jgi:hypothetical protein
MAAASLKAKADCPNAIRAPATAEIATAAAKAAVKTPKRGFEVNGEDSLASVKAGVSMPPKYRQDVAKWRGHPPN